MRKADKKIENALIKGLTEVCDVAQAQFEGFEWLTHLVDYDRFPASLKVVCVFDTNEDLNKSDVETLRSLIQKKLATLDITIKNSKKQIRFDTEENCTREHKGDWQARFGLTNN